ncbi:hypothetical protein ES703_58964 [subsurface metagenome]
MAEISWLSEIRTVEGIIENPSGSGDIQEMKSIVRPPSVVLAQKGLPSLPFVLVAVRKIRQSLWLLTM